MTITDTRTRWLALLVLCLGDLMIVLDGTIVNVALPSIRDDLGFSQESLAWVVNAYLLTFGGFLLLGGRLGDLFGHRRMFLSGIALFTVASLACGLATHAGCAHRSARRSGARRRRRLRGRALADHDPVRGARGAREGDGGVRVRPVRRRNGRRAARRRDHGRPRLALDLPGQPPGRNRRLRADAGAAPGRARPCEGARRPRRSSGGDVVADACRLRDRQRQRSRLDHPADARAPRRGRRPHGDLPRARVASVCTPDAARHLPEPQRVERERRRRADGGRDVRVLLPLRAVPPGGARLQPDGGRASPICPRC